RRTRATARGQAGAGDRAGAAAGRVAGRPGAGFPEGHRPAGPPAAGEGRRPMRALCWQGVNKLSVEDVPQPELSGGQDVLLRVIASSVCGSDLHLLDGYVPAMRSGDVLGHEFLGEVVEVGDQVTKHSVGDRVVVASPVACG